MKIAITGADGNLGSRLVKNYGVEPLSCDVLDKEAVRQELHRVKPDVVVHLAAQTSVDWCQAHEYDAVATNSYGTATVLHMATEEMGEGRVVVISSDQVFDGKEGNYAETDKPCPINVYGESKAAAEDIAWLYNCKVVRISRCFDSTSKDISSYLSRLQNGMKIHVPSFFYRSYCHMDFMAEALYQYASRFDEMPEILHLGGKKPLSFYELICLMADTYGYSTDLVYPRGEKPDYVPRPFKAGLDVSLADKLGLPIYSIAESIQRMSEDERV